MDVSNKISLAAIMDGQLELHLDPNGMFGLNEFVDLTDEDKEEALGGVKSLQESLREATDSMFGKIKQQSEELRK